MTTEVEAAIDEAQAREHAARMKRLLDCALPPPDRRDIRANVLVHLVLQRLRRSHSFRDLPRDAEDDIVRSLAAFFREIGGDMVTDADRELCGLPARGDLGWTREELAVIENQRILLMLRPHPPVLMADVKSQHLQVVPKPGKGDDHGHSPSRMRTSR